MVYLNIDRITIISVGFLLLFIAFNSAQNLSSKALELDGYDKLGFYTLGTLYFFFAIFSFFSTAIVNKIGVKVSLFIGAICYSFWVLCFLPPAFYVDHKDSDLFLFKEGFIYFLLLFSAAINGFGAGILWVAQGKYISDCATENTKGFYFGYFWAFFMASQILGNLIAGLILGNLPQSTFYIIMACIAFAGTMVFLFLRQPQKEILFTEAPRADSESDRELPVQDQQKLLRLETDDSRRPKAMENDFVSDIKETFALLISKRMLYVLPLIVWTAFSQSIFSGSLVPLIDNTLPADKKLDSNSQLSLDLFAMIPLGVGEVLGALVFTQVIDRFGPKLTIYYVMAWTAVAFALLFTYVGVYEYGVLTYFMTFTWGFQDTSAVNFCNCVLGFQFDSKIIPFSVFKFVQSLLTFIFLVIESYLKTQTDYLIYFIVVCIYSFIALAVMLFFDYRVAPKEK